MGDAKPEMRLKLHVLASGSKGNCAVVEDRQFGRPDDGRLGEKSMKDTFLGNSKANL